MKIKKLISVMLLLLIPLSACATNENNNTPITTSSPKTVIEQKSTSGWDISIEQFTLNESLNNASTSLGYTGNTNTVEYKETPKPGYLFCLVKMKVAKLSSDQDFSWDKLILKDNNGTEYKRDDDIYLSDLGFNRMPGTDLNFGTNNGWIAFQINKPGTELTLEYPFTNEIFQYKLK